MKARAGALQNKYVFDMADSKLNWGLGHAGWTNPHTASRKVALHLGAGAQ